MAVFHMTNVRTLAPWYSETNRARKRSASTSGSQSDFMWNRICRRPQSSLKEVKWHSTRGWKNLNRNEHEALTSTSSRMPKDCGLLPMRFHMKSDWLPLVEAGRFRLRVPWRQCTYVHWSCEKLSCKVKGYFQRPGSVNILIWRLGNPFAFVPFTFPFVLPCFCEAFYEYWMNDRHHWSHILCRLQ